MVKKTKEKPHHGNCSGVFDIGKIITSRSSYLRCVTNGALTFVKEDILIPYQSRYNHCVASCGSRATRSTLHVNTSSVYRPFTGLSFRCRYL